MADGENGWSEYKRLIMQEIKDLKDDNKDLEDVVSHIRIEVATLKQKLWIHMALTGSAAASGSAAINWFLQ